MSGNEMELVFSVSFPLPWLPQKAPAREKAGGFCQGSLWAFCQMPWLSQLSGSESGIFFLL